MSTNTVRIGVLGAARIAPTALIAPARDNTEAEVVAVAARDRGRAAAYAGKHGVFPEQFARFLLANPKIRAAFMKHHAALLTRVWWQSHKDRILAGEVEDVFPYPQHIRFHLTDPANPALPSPQPHYLETLHNE